MTTALTTTHIVAGPALAYPGKRVGPVASGAGNGRGEWDWFYELTEREQNRLRYHMSRRGVQPDEWAHTMGYADVEAAMHYWQGMIAEARDEWGDIEEPEDRYERRTLECSDEEWEYVLAELAKRRSNNVQVDIGTPVATVTDIRIPKSVAYMTTADIARLFQVKPNTPVVWASRGKLPAPDEIVAGRRLWSRLPCQRGSLRLPHSISGGRSRNSMTT